MRLPPLRERRDDIPLLAAHFLQRQRSLGRSSARVFSGAVMARLEAHSWPGNVRELRQVVDFAALQRTADRRLLRSLWLGSSRLRAAQGPAEALLDRVGLEGDRDAPAGQLSWGNQKLLAFARLLAGRFRFVLLDEPAAGVSPALRERLGVLIRELSASGVTIALIEHDLALVRELADAVVLLQEGLVVAQGPAAAVLNQPATLELCLGL